MPATVAEGLTGAIRKGRELGSWALFVHIINRRNVVRLRPRKLVARIRLQSSDEAARAQPDREERKSYCR